MKKTKNRTELGRDLEAALKEVVAHRRGEVALEGRVIEPMSAKRVKEIRKKVARSPRNFRSGSVFRRVPSKAGNRTRSWTWQAVFC
jgi:hypothetical protein